MEILILGGTGAMGIHLTEILERKGYHVAVTTRKDHESRKYVKYIKGNAQEKDFFESVCRMQHWNAIVDFMVYDTIKFEQRIETFLEATDQYVFISSARVYADCPDERITENCPRLLDVCMDQEYLSTQEYALAKARQENILFARKIKNWTIVRPSLTYGENRLQLGVYEKENWLYRAMHGRSIVFSKDLMDKMYALSYGRDVADGIAAVIGRQEALGETFHVVSSKSCKWKDILKLYVDELEKITGKKPNIVLTDYCTNLNMSEMKYQVLYGRYFSRQFDNSKISKFVDTAEWMDAGDGLRMCMETFLKNPQFGQINWRIEAYIDKAAGERTPLSEIKSVKNKIIYLCYRYRLEWLMAIGKKVCRIQ
jgi:nucleoside-diphosphate-sugar epimerase